jgi:hypothetical protein
VKKLAKPDSYQYTFDDFNSDRKPTPDWRWVADTVNPQFSNAVDSLLEIVRPSDFFSETLVTAIDTVRIPYSVTPYKGEADVEPDDEPIVVDEKTGATRVPKDEYPEMVNGRKGEGYAHEYATLTIVGRNDPIILAVEPIQHHSEWEGESGESVPWAETVDRLMERPVGFAEVNAKPLAGCDGTFLGH